VTTRKGLNVVLTTDIRDLRTRKTSQVTDIRDPKSLNADIRAKEVKSQTTDIRDPTDLSADKRAKKKSLKADIRARAMLKADIRARKVKSLRTDIRVPRSSKKEERTKESIVNGRKKKMSLRKKSPASKARRAEMRGDHLMQMNSFRCRRGAQTDV
jgi:hypothetical protein